MARQILLPYQEPPSALEERVHDLERRVALLTEALRVLTDERAEDTVGLEPLKAGDDGRETS